MRGFCFFYKTMCKENTFEKLHNIALNAPKSSGVYLWKNADGIIIYVGKAKSLKARLTSYFNSGKDIKTRLLISNAFSLEYIKTQNEYEALLLENTLIKTHTPLDNCLDIQAIYEYMDKKKVSFERRFKV